MKKKNINLNDIVIVKLNNKGKEIYREYENIQNLNARLIFPTLPKENRNLNGKLKFQLWKLFRIFGNSFSLGGDPVFINNNIMLTLRWDEK